MDRRNSENQVVEKRQESLQKGRESEERAYRLAMKRGHLKGVRHDELHILSP